MQYDFYILTTSGLKNALVDTDSDFDCAPFGFVPYRVKSTCQCLPSVVEEFWRCVDLVLESNNLTPQDFIRAVRAYSNGKLYGEHNYI
jgi:hypothetical protein